MSAEVGLTEAERLTKVIASVTDLWDEPLDEAHDIAPIVNAILASRSRPHLCAECPDCIHDGNKCCGCYDGSCCQAARVDDGSGS